MKHLYSIILASILCLGFAACSEEDFASRYPDPSKTPTTTIEKMMTGVFKSGNNYTMPWYMRYYSEPQEMGRWAQTLGWHNAPGMYRAGESNDDDRWKNYYKMIAQYRTLDYMYNNEFTEEQKRNNNIFYLVARIYVYSQLAQMVDLWGDVPFTKAGTLPLTMDIPSSKAPYDSAEDLYKLMLSDLKNINTDLSKITLTTLATEQMERQDYINGGSIAKWRIFCNSLRLRIAARISDQGALMTEGRAVVKEILADPATYPVVSNNNENILINWQEGNLEAIKNQDPQGIKDGLETWGGQLNRASKAMVEALTGDARIDVIIDKNKDGIYNGVDPLTSGTEQSIYFSDKDKIKFYSPLDSATFNRNNKFPGIFITAAEIDLIKAEAITKWGVSGDAKAAFVSGIVKSTEFYYYLNSLSEFRTPVANPSEASVQTFAETKWSSDANKAKLIAIQKWIHYGNILMVEAWGELRKTGFPELQFLQDGGSTAAPTPPNRLRYTADEKSYNRENYTKVQAKDDYYTKIFWAK